MQPLFRTSTKRTRSPEKYGMNTLLEKQQSMRKQPLIKSHNGGALA